MLFWQSNMALLMTWKKFCSRRHHEDDAVSSQMVCKRKALASLRCAFIANVLSKKLRNGAAISASEAVAIGKTALL